MVLEVLGAGCSNGQKLYANALQAAAGAGLEKLVHIEKMMNTDYFLSKGVFTMPALIISGEVVSVRRLFRADEVLDKIRVAQ